MSVSQMKIESKIGPLYLIGSEKSLQGVFWEKQSAPLVGKNSVTEKTVLVKAAIQIEEYLAGKRKRFDIPLSAEGTDFQKSVWKELAKIPYGESRSYKEIAVAVGDASASRAVGMANGKNPLCIIVPCHRVISSDGSLGGYSGGLSIKKRLLSLEKNGVLS